MDLKERLVIARPREESGRRTSDRYDFQKNWALCEILSRHEQDADYCVVLEHHEDIIVLDSELEPSVIELYQIKTRDGTHWLLSELLEREKGRDGAPKTSYLGRLVRNLLIFGEYVRGLHFVSNLPYKVALESKEKSIPLDKIPLSELATLELTKIDACLTEEYAPEAVPTYKKCTALLRCSLSLKEHDEHTQGVLVRFLDKRTPGASYPIPAIYRSLFDEIRRKTNTPQQCRDLAELIRHRSISRSRFDEILRAIVPTQPREQLWSMALTRLHNEGVPLPTIAGSLRMRTRCELDTLDIGNVTLQRFREEIRTSLAAQAQDALLSSILGNVRTHIMATCPTLYTTLGTDYVNASILLEYIDSPSGTGLQSPSPQHSTEAV